MWSILRPRAGAFVFQQFSPRHVCVQSRSLESLQRRAECLTALLRRVRLPRPETFEAGGRTFPLPLATVDAPAGQVRQEELEYLTGFFDGDGCVTMCQTSGRIRLSMSQAIDQADVLLRFRDAFGGLIGLQSVGTGFCRTCLYWSIGGPKMAKAARELGRLFSMKQAQLHIAAAGPTVAPAQRKVVAAKLKQYKERSHLPIDMSGSWSYFAGFFDAEGCIHVSALYPSVRLQVKQINPHALKCIGEFLVQQGMHGWSMAEYQSFAEIYCTKSVAAKEALKCLLANGLLLKRRQAELVLGLSPDTHQFVRSSVCKLNGNQGRYLRLDEVGAAAAKTIASVQRKLRKKSSTEEQAAKLREELQVLKDNLEIHKLELKCNTLRADLRRLLREGAQVMPIA